MAAVGDSCSMETSCCSCSAASQNQPVIPEQVLQNVHSFLDPGSLKSARLVSRQWNAVALRHAQDLKLITWKVEGAEELGLEDDMPAVLRFQEMPPKLFTSLDFGELAECWEFRRASYPDSDIDSYYDDDSDSDNDNFSDMDVDDIGREWHNVFERSCVDFLGDCGYYHHVKCVRVIECEQAESLAVATSRGFLPNLEDLSVGLYHPPREYNYRTQFQAGSLVKLVVLDLYIPTFRHTDQLLRGFLISILDAAPNLRKLTARQIFPLTNQKKLRRLDLAVDRVADFREHISEMLRNVQSTLTHLQIRGLCQFPAELPVLPKLKELAIRNEVSVGNMAISVPNLKSLKIVCGTTRNVSIPRYLTTKPISLKIVEIKCCLFRGAAPHVPFRDLCSNVLTHSPNLERLKIVSACAFSDTNLLNFIVNLDFSNVIVDFDIAFNLTMTKVIKALGRINRVEPGKARGKIEFHNSKWKTSPVDGSMSKQTTKNTLCFQDEDDATIQQFPDVIVKLRQNWDRIHFKYFDIREPWMSTLARDIQRFYLPAEIFGATSY